MGGYVEQKSVLKTLDEAIKGWDKNCGISRMEYLRIRFRNLPYAEVAPVVHGKWKRIDYEPYGHDYVCSVCNQMNDRASRYCPDCGAKMDL